jgi:DNA helicase IV
LVQHDAVPGDVNESDKWEQASLEAAALVEAKNLAYDTVIIDEAQDFAESDWLFVAALARQARLWAFHDPSQAFWDDRAIDETLFRAFNSLVRCYRNPDALWQVARAYGGGQDVGSAPVKAAVAQRVLSVVACPSEQSVPQKVAAEVQRLRGEGFAPGDIAILSLRGKGKSSVLSELSLPGLAIAQADDEDANDKLVVDTFLRFKGLERKAIVVVDLPRDLHKRDKRLHIALTRALSTVRVVASRDAIEADPVLRAAC